MISTDPQKIQELLTRGVANVYPTAEFLTKELTSGRQLSLYVGYDPTAPTLHIGHGITLLKLRQFQDLGHKIIMLIGDFTAMIGDPTDKTAARTRLTREQVLENCRKYQEQAKSIIKFDGPNPAELKYNNDWLGKMSFADVVDLASHFTVQQMMERDMFEKRLTENKPIHLHEFLYPLMQGYDSVAMDVDGEVGGNDQTFNMLAGRTLMREIKGKEKFVMSAKLLADANGKKMGKSEGNMIALSDTPEDMFGKVMTWTDGMIIPAFELCTRLTAEEIHTIHESLEAGANPRDAKLKLAFAITETFLGTEAAEQGRAHFEKVIQGKERPEEIPEIKPSAYEILSVLAEAGMVKSKSDARRDIDGGGVRVNEITITDFKTEVKPGDVIQKGKRFFVKVI